MCRDGFFALARQRPNRPETRTNLCEGGVPPVDCAGFSGGNASAGPPAPLPVPPVPPKRHAARGTPRVDFTPSIGSGCLKRDHAASRATRSDRDDNR